MAVKYYTDQIPPRSGRVYDIAIGGKGEGSALILGAASSTIKDTTIYDQEGTAFGSADVNETCILTCDHSKVGTTHKLSTPNINCKNIKFTATSNYEKGDLVMLNDEYVTAMTIDDEPLSDNYFTLNSVVVCFRVGSVLYFMSHNKGAEIKLLWKNASPESSFSAQTIRIPEAVKYDRILVTMARMTYEDATCTLLVDRGKAGYTHGLQVYKEDSWGMFAYSRYLYFNDERIQFEDTNRINFSGSNTPTYTIDNGRMIPLTIIGVKL